MPPVLSIRGLAKQWRCGVARWGASIDVLRKIDLELFAGESLGVVGPDGAGKSTLLLCAAGLVRPDAGTIAWFGASRWPAGPPGIAYVPDRCPYHRFLTVREALEMYATLHELPGRDRARRVWHALERVGLDAHGDATIARLSRAMLQRLGIAQAVLGAPRLVLLDATLDHLDATTTCDIERVLGELRGDGVAILVASVERSNTERIAARVVTLRDGRLHPVVPLERTPNAAFAERPGRVAEASSIEMPSR